MAGNEAIFQRAIQDGHSAAWDQSWEQAARSYKKALAEFPENPKALNSYALALYQLQKYDEALGVYQQVAKLSPEDPIAFEKIAQLNERLGNLREAMNAALQAAELYLKAREVEKAIENWLRVVQVNPENINARSRLALIHEKTGQTRQAITEYIALASILLHGGNQAKAAEVVHHALILDPSSAEARQAMELLRSGRSLPKPMRPRGGTGPLRMAAVKELEAPKDKIVESPDPITEARQKALTALAEVLFDLSDDSAEAQARRGLQSIMKGSGTGQLPSQAEHTKILLHLSAAIDAQTHNQDENAANELEKAIENGFQHPAAHFDLGLLRSITAGRESGLKNLQQSLKHDDYTLAAHLLSGSILCQSGRNKEAATAYMEALKIADSGTAPEEEAEVIGQLYEPVLESLARENDAPTLQKMCRNIEQMLVRVNWRQHLAKTRREMPRAEGDQALPLADIIVQAQSSHVIDSMNRINALARANHLRSARDEAFYALSYAPTYLPLHILIGDLLIREGRTPEAIAKFTAVSNAYSMRGESGQAVNLLKRILQISPMDLATRVRLIDQQTARGQLDDAVGEYMDLADIYYRLAELDKARKTFTTALKISQQPNVNREWSLRILQRMADIDMQRLDWRQAIRVYEQIRTLKPDDASIRENLVELNLRLAQNAQAQAELDSFISYLDTNNHIPESITFLEKLNAEHPEEMMLQSALAEQYEKAGKNEEAIAMLDKIGDQLMVTGDKEGVARVIQKILTLNPPNAEEYRSLLSEL